MYIKVYTSKAIYGISPVRQDGVRHLLALREDSEAQRQAPEASGCLVGEGYRGETVGMGFHRVSWERQWILF